MKTDFRTTFSELAGHAPFPWQELLYESFLRGEIPERCDIPTGLGKTMAIPIWLIALLNGAPVPRRLVYVVNRRTIVDQSTDVVASILHRLTLAEGDEDSPLYDLARSLRERDSLETGILLGVSTLRGEMADNEEWVANPAAPAVIVGTVDMIGSKLLFRGYGDSRRKRPLNAAFLGCDSLIVHDEAHLTPAFGKLLLAICREQRSASTVPGLPGLAVMELSATHSEENDAAFSLCPADFNCSLVAQRLHAPKKAFFCEVPKDGPPVREKAKELALDTEERSRTSPARVLLFLKSPDNAAKLAEVLQKELRRRSEQRWDTEHPGENMPTAVKTALKESADARVALLTGRLRGHERDLLMEHPVVQGLAGKSLPSETVFLVATSAGEVGIDLDADRMICDLTTLDSMIQRIGRVNRFGRFGQASIHVIVPEDATGPRRERVQALKKARQEFREADTSERKKLAGSIASQGTKVEKARQRVAKQVDKAAVAKTGKSEGKAKQKLAEVQQKLRSLEEELAAKEKLLAEHDKSRLHRFREHRQHTHREFVRQAPQGWARFKTLQILRMNQADLSPTAMREVLAVPSNREAFPLQPEMYPLTPLLLDLWAQTSVARNPACPEVECWLHGKRDEELPETRICWRAEIDAFGDMSQQNIAKWFDLFPLHSTETLRYPSTLVKRRNQDDRLQLFAPMLDRLNPGGAPYDCPVAIQGCAGEVNVTTLADLSAGTSGVELNYATIMLPVSAGGLDRGTFSPKSPTATDVAGSRLHRVQIRRVGDDWAWRSVPHSEWHPLASCERLSQAIGSVAALVEGAVRSRCLFKAQTRFVNEFDEDATEIEEWLALFRPQEATPRTVAAQRDWPTIQEHTDAVFEAAEIMSSAMALPESVVQAILFAARNHDDGKAAEIWQFAAGHSAREEPLAKGNVNWRKLKGYRHETDALLSTAGHVDFADLDEPDLAVHLICAHHGWARPHIHADAFPEQIPSEERERLTVEMMNRFDRLQGRFGWWNLALLESILRRADAVASARENAAQEEEE